MITFCDLGRSVYVKGGSVSTRLIARLLCAATQLWHLDGGNIAQINYFVRHTIIASSRKELYGGDNREWDDTMGSTSGREFTQYGCKDIYIYIGEKRTTTTTAPHGKRFPSTIFRLFGTTQVPRKRSHSPAMITEWTQTRFRDKVVLTSLR